MLFQALLYHVLRLQSMAKFQLGHAFQAKLRKIISSRLHTVPALRERARRYSSIPHAVHGTTILQRLDPFHLEEDVLGGKHLDIEDDIDADRNRRRTSDVLSSVP